MPANIDQTTGTSALVTVGPAWHRLGKVLAAPATAAEALKFACLDWQVSKVPLFAGEREHRPWRSIAQLYVTMCGGVPAGFRGGMTVCWGS